MKHLGFDFCLVRDQGVGGSNPLSPTILFKHLQPRNVLLSRPSGFSPGVLMPEGAHYWVFDESRIQHHLQKHLQQDELIQFYIQTAKLDTLPVCLI